MDSSFRTIDNLGIDPSVRYAEDQSLLDEKFSQDQIVRSKTEIDVSMPSYLGEFDQLFQTKKANLPWAQFFLPPYYNDQKRRLFTHVLLPHLESDDAYDRFKRKILERVKNDKERHQAKKQSRFQKGMEYDWEEEVNRDAAEKESKTLISTIDLIQYLDKILAEISSRRNQYQKG